MRKYTVTVNYDCKRYVENIYANNLREANNYAISVGCKITNGGSTGWLQSVNAKQGWIGSKVGVVHDPRPKNPVTNLIEKGVSESAARFIVYGPETDNDECPDLE